MKHFEAFLCAAFVFFNTIWNVWAIEHCVQRLDDCVGSESDCYRSLPCHHGECDPYGNNCLCQSCWGGPNCDQYVDHYAPKFLVPEKYVTVSSYDTGIIFTCFAFDKDEMQTCQSNMPCPCARVQYKIASGNDENVFQIDPVEGQVSLNSGKKLEPGKQYHLVIHAFRFVVNNTILEYTNTADSTLEVTLNVRSRNEVRETAEEDTPVNGDDNSEEVHQRRKRDATVSSSDTVISMTQLSPTVSTVLMNVGDRADFQVEVVIPAGITMDLTVEIFTADPDSGSSAFSLCNIITEAAAELQPSSTGTIEPQTYPNQDLPEFNDRAILYFGLITAPESASDADRTITITFTATLLDNTPFVANGSSYSVVAGASYDNDSYIWVGQAPFTALLPSADVKYSSSVFIDGLDTIPIENYGIYTLHLFSAYPQSKYYIDVFGYGTKQDSYSSGPIVFSKVGDNYPCMTKDLLSYNYKLIRSVTEQTIEKSSLETGRIINCDNSGRQMSNSSGNEMLIMVTIYIPDDPTLVGSQLGLGATIRIDDDSIWASLFNVTIESKGTPVVRTAVMTPRNNSIIGRVMGVTSLLVDFTIPENTYSDIILEVLTPEDVADPPIVSVCGFTTSSGANIPFVPNNKDPELSSRNSANVMDKMVVNLGKIYNSAIVPGNDSASTITITVNVKIDDSAAEGKSIALHLLSADGTTTVASQSVTIEIDPTPMNSTSTDVDVEIVDMLKESTIALEAETAAQVTLSFNSATVINDLSVQIFGSLSNDTVQARVCRAELTFVSQEIPCVNKRTINSNVNYQKRDPLGDLYNLATLDIGSVCISNDKSQNGTDNQLVVSFSVELPQQPQAIDGESYTMYSGIKFGTEMIWTGSSTYTVSTTVTSLFAPDSLPIVMGFLSSDMPATAGSTTIVYIMLKIPPQSRAAYTLTITAAAGQNIGICKVTMAYVGHNFPCVDVNPQPGNTSRVATTRLNYDEKDTSLSAYLSAVLDFGPLSNLGEDILVSNSNDDKNTIRIGVIMKLAATATGTVNLDYILKYTSQTSDGTGSVAIPILTDTPPTASNPNITFEAFNGTDIHINVTKILVLKFQISPPASLPVTVLFTNPKGSATDYGFCSASVTSVGKNIPCLNATDITPTSTDTSSGCKSTLMMDLGNICFTSIVNDTNEDWITVEVGMNIVDLTLTGTVSVQGSVTAGGSTYDVTPISLTVDAKPLDSTTQGNISVVPVINDSIPCYIGVRTWVDINVTISEGSLVRLTLTAFGASADGRSVMTVSDVKVSAAGTNVACIKNGTNIDVQTSTSDVITTLQKDRVFVDFGYIFNTGFTYRRGYKTVYDDQLTVSVQVTMTDHPNANDGVQFPLKIAIETDSQLYEETQMLTVVRNATEKPSIQTVAEVLNAKLFKPEEIVNLRLRLSHVTQSSAEPTETAIRLFLPYYMNYSNSLSANVSISETYGNIVVLKILSPFLFDDIYEINFTLTVDPYDKRGPGAVMTNATTLGRIMAHVTQRTINAASYPATADYLYAGDIFYVSYSITGEGCHDALGMENGQIKDCQLSASTITLASSGPSSARLNGPSGTAWKPALRNNGYMDYLQVDFGNLTRVSRIDIQKDSCCRAVTSIILQYSFSGLQWSNGHTELSLNYSSDIATVNLKRTMDGRMMRILINETDEPENVDTKYIGMKVEFYGCVLGTDVSLDDVCSQTPKTIESTNVSQYRHFSVATSNDAIFACDVRTTSWELSCFCSADGSTWKLLPNYISNIIGYDNVEGQTFARDSKNTSILRSKDCKTWLTATAPELDKAIQNGQFSLSSVIAGLSKDDPQMTQTIGKWKGVVFKENLSSL